MYYNLHKVNAVLRNYNIILPYVLKYLHKIRQFKSDQVYDTNGTM